jgi:predicted small lipoprotein YifL
VTLERRSALLNAFAIVTVATALVACGVKGELEAPPRANLTDSKTDAAVATETRAGVKASAKTGTKTGATATGATAADVLAAQPESRALTEQSVVQSKGYPTVLPRLPPEEWQKYRQEESQKAKTRSKTKDDTPFFLDPIL